MSYFVLRMISEAFYFGSFAIFFVKENITATIIAISLYIAYVIMQIAIQKCVFDYDKYQFLTRMKLIFWAIFCIIISTSAGAQMTSDAVPTNVLGIVAFAIDFCMLRDYRLGRAAGRKRRLINLLLFFIGTFIALGAGILLFESRKILLPLFSILGLILGTLFNLILKCGGFFEKIAMELWDFSQMLVKEKELDPSASGVPVINGEFSDRGEAANALNDNIDKILAFIIIGVLIFVIMFIIIRFLVRSMKNHYVFVDEQEFSDTGYQASAGNKKKRKLRKMNNKEQIRKIYSDYLLFLNKKGLYIKVADTSEDILNFTLNSNEHELDTQLRELYIRIRYADKESVSDEDVKLAKKLYKGILDREKHS